MHYLTAAVLRELEAKLSERDWEVLRQVSALHFVSGSQLARLCFTNNQGADLKAARRSLLRLTRFGVLERLPRPIGGVRAGSAGFVYHLGLAGQRLATIRGWQPERRRRRSQTPGTLFLRHTLLIAELHTLLTEADRSRSIELLELSAEPVCWRSYSGRSAQRLTLKPDSYARLGVGDFEDSYFFEIDRGTEGSRTIARQLSSYLDYYGSGQEQAVRGVFPRTLWLTDQPERVAVIEDCVRQLPSTAQELFRIAPFTQLLEALLSTE